MVDFLQLAFAGISQGAAYGLVAVGFVVIFKVSGVLNLAQGEFAILGAFTAITATKAGVPLPLAVLLAVIVVGVLAGVLERLTITPAAQRLRDSAVSSFVAYIILTLGIGLALRGVAQLAWGSSAQSLSPFTAGTMDVGGVILRLQNLWVIAITLVVAVALHLFFDRTIMGRAFTACAEQPLAARLVGIPPARMSRLSFVIAGMVAAIGGIAVSPVASTSANSGLLLALKGIVAAALAGFGSIPGAIAGGLVLGGVESLTAGYISSGLKDGLSLLALIALLVLRPQGLFGRLETERV